MARSDDRLAVSVSVALLLPAASVTPAGAVTVAVLTRLAVAAELVWATTGYVWRPPAGMLTVWLMLPEPLAVKTVPAAPVAVQASAVTIAEKLSAAGAPTTFDGPALLTTMV